MEEFGIFVGQAAAFGVLSAVVASTKNRAPAKWGALGFLFGVFGFIAAIAVSKVEARTESSTRLSVSENAEGFDPDQHEKKCPMCAEYIKLEARVCKHCGHEFSQEEVEQQITQARSDVRHRNQGGEIEEPQRQSVFSKKVKVTVLGGLALLSLVVLLVFVLVAS
jgi:hypothetical protein